HNVAALYVVMLITGVSFGGFSSVFAPLIGEYFGLTHLGKIVAGVFSNGAPAGLIGPLLAGYIFDTTGSYHWAFVASGAMCFLAVACSFFVVTEVKRPRPETSRSAGAACPP
ncbi:MAG: MFS transporter, partial [Dehalococcoidia bacterium]|nr:MFS transporter [Dehalococcoidia bacterium]